MKILLSVSQVNGLCRRRCIRVGNRKPHPRTIIVLHYSHFYPWAAICGFFVSAFLFPHQFFILIYTIKILNPVERDHLSCIRRTLPCSWDATYSGLVGLR